MLRCILAALAALVLVTVTLIPDDAEARGGRGGGVRAGAGGFRGGGAMHAGRFAHPSHPIAGRGRVIAGRPGYGYGGGRYYRRGLGYGAIGAAAAAGAYGAYYYGNSGCYYDEYGQVICPQQYPYQYQYRY